MSDKKPDIKKFLFFLPIPIVILIMGYVYFSGESKENTGEGTSSQAISFDDLPVGEETAIFNSKIEAYEEHRKDSLRELYKDENIGLKFGSLDKDTINNNKINFIGLDETNTEKENNSEVIEEINKLKSIITLTSDTKKKEAVYKTKEQPVVKKSKKETTTEKQPGKKEPVKKKRVKSRYSAISLKQSKANTIAVIHGEQKIYNASKIKMRILNELRTDNGTIPRNTFIYGEVRLGRKRVYINIPSIVYNENILNLKLTVHDNDGIEGVFIPGGITQEISNESAAEILNEPIIEDEGDYQILSKVQKVASKWNKTNYAIIPDGYKVYLKKE